MLLLDIIDYYRIDHLKVPQWLARFFATCGALSAEYGPVTWVGLHRQHHKHSDKALDPHNAGERNLVESQDGCLLEPW